MIQNRIRKKHEVGIEWTDILFIIIPGLICLVSCIHAFIVLFVVATATSCTLYILYQHLYSVNRRCGELTDKFVASVCGKTDIKEIKEMIVRYNSDCYYSYNTYNYKYPDAYCKLLEDSAFGYSKDGDDNVLDKDTEYVLEKGTMLEIPHGYVFQVVSGGAFPQMMIKSNSSSKCFNASGSYRKINGRRKSLYKVPVKIKAGAKVQIISGVGECLSNFKTYQKNNLYMQYLVAEDQFVRALI